MDINELLIASFLSSDSTICVWDYNTISTLKLIKNGGVVNKHCLEVFGQDYIFGCESGKPILHIWTLNQQENSKNTRLILPGSASCLALCPRNLYLAVGIDCKVYVWQIASGKLLSVHQKNYQPINAIKFSSDGDYLIIAGQDGILTVYNFAELINLSNSFLTQSDIGHVEPLYTKNDHSISITDVYVGSFGRNARLATVSSDQTCRIYKLVDGELLATLIFNDALTAVTFDAPCWQIFFGNNNGDICQFDLKEKPRRIYPQIQEGKKVFHGQKGKILCMAINVTNVLLATGSDNDSIFVWEIKTRQILKRIESKGPTTNIKFILGYQNFFLEKFVPCRIVKNLERAINLSDTKLIIAQMQTDDIDIKDMTKSLEKEHIVRSLAKENIKLRSINNRLYNAALKISKKYNYI